MASKHPPFEACEDDLVHNQSRCVAGSYQDGLLDFIIPHYGPKTG